MNIFVGFCNLIIPIVMIILGILWKKYYPKDISDSSGYRTEQSMKSKEAWVYSQELFAGLCLIEGIITLLLSVILMIVLVWNNLMEVTDITPLLLLIQFSSFIPIYIIIEVKLKSKFNSR